MNCSESVVLPSLCQGSETWNLRRESGTRRIQHPSMSQLVRTSSVSMGSVTASSHKANEEKKNKRSGQCSVGVGVRKTGGPGSEPRDHRDFLCCIGGGW